MYPMYPQPGF